jgi:hypothetical protein
VEAESQKNEEAEALHLPFLSLPPWSYLEIGKKESGINRIGIKSLTDRT